MQVRATGTRCFGSMRNGIRECVGSRRCATLLSAWTAGTIPTPCSTGPLTNTRGLLRRERRPRPGRLLSATGITPRQHVQPGGQIPAAIDHFVGDLSGPGDQLIGLGALRHDPDLSEAKLALEL